MIILAVLVIVILFLSILFVYLWNISNDHTVKAENLPRKQKILAIYPHPDDEVLTCGGVLFDFVQVGAVTYAVVLTKGERGVEGAVLTPSLKKIREQEMRQSAHALQVSHLYHHDLGDGELPAKEAEVKKIIHDYIDLIQPDLVLTYDQSGLYGHPDHIVVSRLVTEIVQTQPQIELWYATRPKKVFHYMKLPTHMAKDKDFLKFRTYPSFRIPISWQGMVAKTRSMYAHQSQHFAFKKSRPWLPLWFYLLTQSDEYFYKVL